MNQTPSTKAQEMLYPLDVLTADYCDDLDDFDKAGFFDEIMLKRGMIIKALLLYDRILRGELKALGREPTREMLAPIYGDVYEDGKYYWDCENDILKAAQDEWSMGWDAAPATPDSDGIEG